MKGILRALAEPRRVEILRLVRRRERTAGEIAGHFEVTRPAISQHLRVLTEAGLVRQRREGTRRIYSLRREGVEELHRFLGQFWDIQLKSLKHAVEQAGGRRVHGGRRRSRHR